MNQFDQIAAANNLTPDELMNLIAHPKGVRLRVPTVGTPDDDEEEKEEE